MVLVLWATAAAWLMAWPWYACLVLNVVLAGLLARQLWPRNRCCQGRPVAAIEFDGQGWYLRFRDGQSLRLLPEPGPFQQQCAVAVRFRLRDFPSGVYDLFLLAPGQDQEDWRRLHLALRYGDPAGSRTVSLAFAARSG